MRRTFAFGLVILSLLVPQHGNSPVPRMETWMEMDQGDGFVDRDLTSSLTGAESFGSAHKNYQNSLIRKKETESEEGSSEDDAIFSGILSNRNERKAQMKTNLLHSNDDGRYQSSGSGFDNDGYHTNARIRSQMYDKGNRERYSQSGVNTVRLNGVPVCDPNFMKLEDGGEELESDELDENGGVGQELRDEDDEYYGEDRNLGLVNDEAPDAGIIYKREENKGKASKLTKQSSVNGVKMSKLVSNLGKASVLHAESPKEAREVAKDKSSQRNMDTWTNEKLHSKELNDVIKDSQRALDEVQAFQHRAPAKPQNIHTNDEWKRAFFNDGKRNLDERRGKREDEDEQKNMKTGTDEGGGEYEDEEGKGHNDQEDYYEEVGLSAGDLHQKLYKRGSGKVMHREAPKKKDESENASSDDCELNVENAPIEDDGQSSSLSEEMIEELAKDYSSYVKVDFNSELHNVQETIDDMLTRLDEFENLVNMVRTDGELCVDVSIPHIMKSKENLEDLFDRIDRLHHFVNRVKSDMEIIESQVEEAEQSVGQNSRAFKNIFKPLFFSSPDTPSRRPNKTPTYEAPTVFSTASYFPQSEGSEEGHSS